MLLTVNKQEVDIFSGQNLVDYIKGQADLRIYKSTILGYKSTKRLKCVCFKAFNILYMIHKIAKYP